MSNFQWETEEEIDWEQPETAVSPSRTASYRRRYLIWGSLALLLTLAAGIALTRQLQERIAEGQALVEADLLASVSLVRETAVQQDRDVFNLLLSGRDPDWADQVEALVGEGLLTDRSLLGLTSQGEPNISVELSSDLLSAEVTSQQPYRYAPFGQPPRIVTLTETAVYRKGENRWLLAPPEEPFWGERLTIESDGLIIGYDERDAPFAEQFADRFLADFNTFCTQTLTVTCPDPEQLQIIVSFSSTPATLNAASINAPLLAPSFFADPELAFTLPSPTIFGAPEDDGATAVLYDIHATQLLRGVLNVLLSQPDGNFDSITPADCCSQPLFRRALIDYELAQVGLQPWPITGEDYVQLAANQFTFNDLTPLWQTDSLRALEGQEQTLYAALTFVLQELTTSTTSDLLAAMRARNSYLGWLQSAWNSSRGTGNNVLERLDNELALRVTHEPFIANETAVSPATTLYAICNSNITFNEPEALSLILFTPNDPPEVARSFDGFALIEATPDNKNLLLLSGVLSEEGRFSWKTEQLDNAQLDTIFPVREPNAFSFLDVTPNGELIMFAELENGSFEDKLVMLDDCGENGCSSSGLAGTTVWSPDGQQTLIQLQPRFESGTLLVNGRYSTLPQPLQPRDFLPIFFGNERGIVEQASEIGYSPFWIDNSRFSYVRLTPREFSPNARELVVLSVASSDPEHLISSEQFNAALPESAADAPPLLPRYAAPHPQNSNQLFIITESTRNNQPGALFRYDLPSAELTYLFDILSPFHTLSFSPNGRFLLFEQSEWFTSSAVSFHMLHDLETGQTERIPFTPLQAVFSSAFHTWSPDGNQLALTLDNNLLGLINLETGEKSSLPHPFGTCNDLAWTQN